VNLETHIQDVTGVLAAENIQDAVLVGHSYGGMVITAVADRMPERVDSLVYLDAVVPANGDSCWALVSDNERQWYLDVVDNGYAVRTLPFFDARATPHPLASLLQPLQLTSDLGHIRRSVYVYAAGWDGESPFTAFYHRLRENPSWMTYALDSGHNLMRDAPKDLLKILLEIVEPHRSSSM
jgi:pimeloyl-ACP methyl ester carboxylesterase